MWRGNIDKPNANMRWLLIWLCLLYRLEYFSVTFNILFGFINLMDDILTLVCWHTSPKNVYLYRVCMSLKLFAWSYIFLNLLPFKFLIPTLYGRKFHLGLNCFLWLWYGSSVWNSVFINSLYASNVFDSLNRNTWQYHFSSSPQEKPKF